MDQQEIEAGLALLLDQMEDEAGDPREIFMKLTALLNGMRALNLPLPADLAEMEAEMAKEFTVPEAPGKPAG